MPIKNNFAYTCILLFLLVTLRLNSNKDEVSALAVMGNNTEKARAILEYSVFSM